MPPPSAVEPPHRNLARTLVAVLVIGVLILAAFWIVRPFLAPTIWATMIVVVTWPFMLRLQARLWQSRPLAIVVMVVILLMVFVIPLTLVVGMVFVNAAEIAVYVRSLASLAVPVPPAWVTEIPVVGGKVAMAWQEAAAAGVEGLWMRFLPYSGKFTAWLVAEAGSVGYLAIQFLLTLLIAAFLYAHGEEAAGAALRFGRRLGGRRGVDLVQLAGQAIRGVAVGVGLTAVFQTALGGFGLALAGVPFTGLLTAVLFMLCITQIGMPLVLIPAVIWVYWTGHPVLGTALLLWSVFASFVDTVLRPILVRRTADLPLLLIFAGVIGGLIAFGLVGIFVGPVVLAVAYTLLLAWLDDRPQTPTAPKLII